MMIIGVAKKVMSSILANRQDVQYVDILSTSMQSTCPYNVRCTEGGLTQRATYSSYYGENCVKGGIFCNYQAGWVPESYSQEL